VGTQLEVCHQYLASHPDTVYNSSKGRTDPLLPNPDNLISRDRAAVRTLTRESRRPIVDFAFQRQDTVDDRVYRYRAWPLRAQLLA